MSDITKFIILHQIIKRGFSSLYRLVLILVFLLSSLVVTPRIVSGQEDCNERKLRDLGVIVISCDNTTLSCEVGTSTVEPGSEGAEQRREDAYNYFVSKLAETSSNPKKQSAGIIGNLWVETGGTMDPAVEQGFVHKGFDADAVTRYGLAQWTSPGRKHSLETFAQATNRPVSDFGMQLDFIWFEITGEPETQGLAISNGTSYDTLIIKTTVEDSAVSWARLYERNADSIAFGKGELSYGNAFSGRIGASEQTYNRYSRNIVGASSGSSLGCVDSDIEEACADGTIDLGIHGTWIKGTETTGKLCAITNLPSSGPASTPGSQFYVDGSDGLAIVSTERSGKVYAMVAAVAADGVSLRARSSFRTHENQEFICNSSPACVGGDYKLIAEPGSSSHESGSAIDFVNMSDGVTGGQTCSSRDRPNTDEWTWMLNNSSEYGYLQYSKEGWHWDTRSDLSNRCDSTEI